jgi:ribonuclease P/MRP protein subunit POP5
LLKRVRRRYIAVEIDSGEAFDSKVFMDAVWSAISKLYGEYGASRTGLTLIDYDAERKVAVIRVVHTALDMVRVALASITKVNDKPASMHVIAISGTIKALYKKIEKQL